MCGFPFHVAVASAVASYAELERLQFFVDAIAGRQMLGFGIGFDLPPFARDAKSP